MFSSPPVVMPTTPTLLPLSEILARPMSDQKIDQVTDFILQHNRSDADVISEQVPNLLLLINEAWISDESMRKLEQLFSPKSPLFQAIGPNTLFVFPLQNKFLTSVLLQSNSLLMIQYLSSRDFMNLSSRTLNLKSLEYFFFSFAVLPFLKDTGTAKIEKSSSWSSWKTSSNNWSTSASYGGAIAVGSSNTGRTYASDGLYEKLLEEYISIAVSDNHRIHDLKFLRGCQLLLSCVIDIWLEAFDSTGGGKLILKLLQIVLKVVLKSDESKLGGIFLTRLSRVLTDLFVSSKWLTRIDLDTSMEFVHLWAQFCQPWKSDEKKMMSWHTHVLKYSFVYNCYPLVLRIGSVRDFVADYIESVSGKAFSKFLDLPQTKVGVDIFVSVLEVLAPSDACVLSILAQDMGSSNLLKTKDSVNETVSSVTRQIWSVARECTWHNHSVPKNLSNESWRMDKIVNQAKESLVFRDFSNLLVWEKEEEFGIPKNLTAPNRVKMVQDRREEYGWDLPVCASEYEWVVGWVKNWTEILIEIDLKKNPKKLAFLRRIGSVSFLIFILISSWMYLGGSIGWTVHLSFLLALIAMVMKWARSVMYVV